MFSRAPTTGRLVLLYVNTGEMQRGAENMKKAFELRERVSDRENLMLSAAYQGSLGDLEGERKPVRCGRRCTRMIGVPSNCLGNIYSLLGDYEKALAPFTESLRRDPTPIDYGNVVEQYLSLNRFEEAKATAREAQARHFDNAQIHYLLYIGAVAEHDAAGMERELDILRKSDPLWQRGAAEHERNTAFSLGQFKKAKELTQRAVTIAEGAGAREAALVPFSGPGGRRFKSSLRDQSSYKSIIYILPEDWMTPWPVARCSYSYSCRRFPLLLKKLARMRKGTSSGISPKGLTLIFSSPPVTVRR